MKQTTLPYKVLVVDDDPTIVDWLTMILEFKGFTVASAKDAFSALLAVKEQSPDLVILDLHLGEHMIQGTEVLWRIKSDPASAAAVVLIFTAVRDKDVERLCMDEYGADGYILKGVAQKIDLSRMINAWLRRLAIKNAKNELVRGALRIDLAKAQAYLEDKPLPLTPREYNLLAYTARKSPDVARWDTLASKFWQTVPDEQHHAPDSISACLVHLRSKLGMAAYHLVTVRNSGLTWVNY
ncbi:MAG: response regulator transcription factor [Elusimicrobiota bacterium]